ncbi:hypothetical protein DFH07DRAFT_831609 [Mycena maculata]|uniref:Uncharacterized protein n=1 Tax=Mycena maculata TaxID=230809 RepID=A0AAD7N5J9_9AGAR|nr:hypothetical protein DFH07DRAFT_831609 [Mycena maculata]
MCFVPVRLQVCCFPQAEQEASALGTRTHCCYKSFSTNEVPRLLILVLLVVMRDGSLGVAIVSRRVMVFQAAQAPTMKDRFLDVYTFIPFGAERVFLATHVPKARITTSDILTIFPPDEILRTRSPSPGMLQLPEEAFMEFSQLRSRNQEYYEKLWNAWAVSH